MDNDKTVSSALPFAQSDSELSFPPSPEVEGGPPAYLTSWRQGPLAVIWGTSGSQRRSSPWVAGTSACTDKETLCTTKQQAGSLHFRSSACRHPSATLLMPWWLPRLKEESAAAKYTYFGLQRTWLQPFAPLLTILWKGWQIMQMSHSLGPKELAYTLGEKSSLSSAFHL